MTTRAQTSAPKGLIAIVLFASFVDVLGFGIMLPTLPFFARDLGAGAELVTLCMAAYTFGLFLGAPLWGRISDRLGRKPVICIGLIGTIACYILLAFSVSVWMVASLRLVAGLMAGNLSACTAYIVDVTSEEERATYMGLGGAIFGLGFVVGPLIGSFLGGETFETANFVRPSLTAAGLSMTSLLVVSIFLPESRRKISSSAALRDPIPPRRWSARVRSLGIPLLTVGGCSALYNLASGFYETILPLWAADFDLIEGPEGMWMLLLPTGIAFIVVQGAIVPPLVKRFGEPVLIRASAVLLAASTYLMTVAGSASSLVGAMGASGVMAALAAVILSSGHILASKLVDESERGEVLGLFSSAGTLSRTGGMAVSGLLYDGLHHHAPYWIAAATTCLLGVLAWYLVVVMRRLQEAPAVAAIRTGEAPAALRS